MSGLTPLIFAADGGHAGTVKLLLDANADPLLTEYCSKIDPWCQPFVPLDAAARHGHLAVVTELIERCGIDGCGGASGGVEALRLAAQKRRIDTMAMLMEAGVVDDMGTALSYSASDGLEASTKFLLQRQQQQQQQNGKTTGGIAYPNKSNPYGINALFSGIVSPFPRIVRLLVDVGADTTSALLLKGEGRVVRFNDTPVAFATKCLREKKFSNTEFTEKDLRRLEAIRRLLLRVEAIHAVSWLWPNDVHTIACAAQGTTTPAKTASVPLKTMLPIVRQRPRRRAGVLFAAQFR